MRALIAILPGDGIGPEVTAEAARVLAAVGKLYGHSFEVREALVPLVAEIAEAKRRHLNVIAACSIMGVGKRPSEY